jgi:hypothetical protein
MPKPCALSQPAFFANTPPVHLDESHGYNSNSSDC